MRFNHSYNKIFKKFLFISLFLIPILYPSLSVNADITTGLIGHWKFDENTLTNANDSSSNANNGTITNATWTSGPYAGLGSALEFEQTTNDIVNIGSPSTLDNITGDGTATSSMTVSAWINPNECTASSCYIVNKMNSTNRGWYVAVAPLTNDGIAFLQDFNGTDLAVRSQDASVTYGSWQHVIVTWDGSQTATNVHIYINGTETPSYDLRTDGVGGKELDTVYNFSIGNSFNVSRDYDGAIDDVRIYNRILSSGDIAELYAYTGAVAPTATTTAATSVSTSTLTLNGAITATGGVDATQSGFAYGTDSTLATVIATSTLGSQSETASFTSDLSSLTPNTTYYFRAYATNPAGTGYGEIYSTTTLAVSAPTVTTQSASSISSAGATGNGNITVTGNINPTVRGFAYGETTAYGATTTETGNFSTGAFTGSISGLTCNTTYHYTAYAVNSVGTSTSADTTFVTSACAGSNPTLTTDLPTLVATSTLTLNGSITVTGGSNATQSGFAYGTDSTLATVIATSTLGSQTGTASFSSSLSSLTPNTTYYFRAYATNTAGTGYGSIESTTTLAISRPTVTTQSASSISSTGATGNGNITVTGNINPTVRGFRYGETTAYGATTTENGNFSTGAFTGSISGLTCEVTYHYVAYATNSQGVSYGSDDTFTTSACAGSNPTMTTDTPTSVSTSTFTLNGSITVTGGSNATQSGFAYGTNSALSTVIATTTLGAQTGTASFSSDISGLTANTLYYFRAYATNSTGTGYGSIQSTTTLNVSKPTVTAQSASSVGATSATGNGTITVTGYINPTVRGFVYGLTSSYTATTTENGNFSTGAFTGSISGLTCNITYHYTAYATNSQGTSYGSDDTFTTSACIPSLTTSDSTSVSTSTLTLNGAITATGGADATQSGFAYGTNSALSTVIATTTLGAQTGTASFSSSLSSLTANTTYYFRAYATNSAGTGYGTILSTTTLAVSAPTVTTSAASSVTNTSSLLNANISSVGRETATEHGFALGTSATLSSGTATSTLGVKGATTFTESVSSLVGNTTYYFRAYATNSSGTGFGTIQSFTTDAITAPSVTTGSVSSVTTTTGTASGSITSNGGEDATQYGFTYSTASDFATSTATTTEGTFSGMGNISSSLSSLVCSTTYYIKAYATNSSGVGYGSTSTFTTSSCVSNSSQSNSTSRSMSFVGTNQFFNQIPFINNILNKKIVEVPKVIEEKIIKKDTFPTFLMNTLNTYPELESKFKEMNIMTVGDLQKLANQSIDIPTIADISKLPPEMVIAQAGNGRVPIVSSIALNKSGQAEQRLRSIVGSDISLAIKPISKANSVNGVIYLKKGMGDTAIEVPLSTQTASVFLSVKRVNAQSSNNITLKSFSYADGDGDGIYTASVKMPETEGTYEVKTTIDYVDKKLGKKEVNVTAIVDHEGYVFEKIQGKEARIPNVIVTIYDALNNKIWDATKYGQVNPQKTNMTGKYFFILPKGKYYLTAETDDYEKYIGKIINVDISSGIFEKISLDKKKGFFGKLFEGFLSIFR